MVRGMVRIRLGRIMVRVWGGYGMARVRLGRIMVRVGGINGFRLELAVALKPALCRARSHQAALRAPSECLGIPVRGKARVKARGVGWGRSALERKFGDVDQ